MSCRFELQPESVKKRQNPTCYKLRLIIFLWSNIIFDPHNCVSINGTVPSPRPWRCACPPDQRTGGETCLFPDSAAPKAPGGRRWGRRGADKVGAICRWTRQNKHLWLGGHLEYPCIFIPFLNTGLGSCELFTSLLHYWVGYFWWH